MPRPFRIWVLLVACLFVGIPLGDGLRAQVCQDGVVPADNAELAYKLRGDRCEGLVARPVSAGLRLLGFHRHPLQWGSGCDGSPGEPLVVTVIADEIDAAEVEDVHLRALSTRRGLHYRMDARLSRSQQLEWSREVLRDPDVCLRSGEVAILACAGKCETVPPSLYAVSVIEGSTELPPEKLSLVFRAGVDLEELELRITDKGSGRVVYGPRNVLDATMPAEMIIPVPIDGLRSGAYRIDATARPRGRRAADRLSAELSVP